jgi:hypothetical protein
MSRLFNKYQIGKMTESAVHKAYSTLRSIANKRIERLDRAGLGRTNVKFPTIQTIKDTDKFSVRDALADVSKFLRSDRTTVRGEKQFINHFQEQMTESGYGDLVSTREDIYNMIDYMDYLREVYSDKLFDSGDALDVLQQGKRLNIPMEKLKENYDLFASNIDKMENLRRSPGGRAFSQNRIKNLIKKWS